MELTKIHGKLDAEGAEFNGKFNKAMFNGAEFNNKTTFGYSLFSKKQIS